MEGEHSGTSQFMSWLGRRRRKGTAVVSCFLLSSLVLSRPLVYGMVPLTFSIDFPPWVIKTHSYDISIGVSYQSPRQF